MFDTGRWDSGIFGTSQAVGVQSIRENERDFEVKAFVSDLVDERLQVGP
jgi:hypothetical protein